MQAATATTRRTILPACRTRAAATGRWPPVSRRSSKAATYDTSSYSGSGDLEKTVAGFTVTGDQTGPPKAAIRLPIPPPPRILTWEARSAWSDHDGFGSTQGNSNTYSDYGGDGSYTLPSSSGNMNGTQSIQGSDSTKEQLQYQLDRRGRRLDRKAALSTTFRLKRLFLRRLRRLRQLYGQF